VADDADFVAPYRERAPARDDKQWTDRLLLLGTILEGLILRYPSLPGQSYLTAFKQMIDEPGIAIYPRQTRRR